MIRTGLIATVAALAVMAGAWLWLAQSLPADAARVPVHWGADGRADRFASRETALLMFAWFPGSALLVTALLAAAPMIEPLRANLERSKRAYLIAWVGTMALLALISVGLAAGTLGSLGGADARWMIRFIIAGVGVLFIALGDALPKTRPNFFVGVRTPWTLTSDLSWEKTHRLAGRLFVLVGVWGVIAAFTLDGMALALSLSAPAIAAALVAVVYSYFVWRDDPERRQPAREA